MVRLRIPGFTGLSASEKLQASALALNRDLSIGATSLKLAVVAAPDSADEAMIAYCVAADASAASRSTVSTHLLSAVQPGVVYWVNAPAGYVIGERGAAAVELTAANDNALPSVVATTIATAGHANVRCVLVDRDRAAVSDEMIAHWGAASGAEMLDGALPIAAEVTLVAPPRARITRVATGLDRALQWSAIAGVACAVFAGFQLASVPAASAVQGTVDGKRAQSTPGALLSRIATVTPDAAVQLQSGTYAGGAWVLAVPDSVDASAMKQMTRALETNGLAVQSTAAPNPRLRVQLP